MDKKAEKSFIIRADGNPAIGSGHVMRCLSIADGLKKTGVRVIFVTADTYFRDVIISRGHENITLETSYDEMEKEEERFFSALKNEDPKAVLVDSYYVTEKYLKDLRLMCEDRGTKLFYMDDILSFPYPCHTLINYNVYASKDAYERLYEGADEKPDFILGPAYVPLRAEFHDLPKRTARSEIKDILVSTGGADAEHFALSLIRQIKKHPEKTEGKVFHFIIGAVNADRDAIIEEAKEAADTIVLHEKVTKMAELMMSCDAAISAAGSTLYELCATETPTVTYILADNQIPGAEGFEKLGIMKNCGDLRVLGAEKLAETLIDEVISLPVKCSITLPENEDISKKIWETVNR